MGMSPLPYYQVSVTLADAGGIADASCTCPYDWGGYCKHIVAVLLAALQGADVVVKPDLEALLAPLTEKQLRRVLQALAEGRPGLVDDIERAMQWLTQEPAAAGPATAVAHAIPVDLAAIRREIGKDLRSFEHGGGGCWGPTRRGPRSCWMPATQPRQPACSPPWPRPGARASATWTSGYTKPTRMPFLRPGRN